MVVMRWLFSPFAYFFRERGFLMNSVPHLVAGISGSPFQTPFASPPGEGLSSMQNKSTWWIIVLAMFNLLVAYLLLCRTDGHFELRQTKHVISIGLGLPFVMALMLAFAHSGDRTVGFFDDPGREKGCDALPLSGLSKIARNRVARCSWGNIVDVPPVTARPRRPPFYCIGHFQRHGGTLASGQGPGSVGPVSNRPDGHCCQSCHPGPAFPVAGWKPAPRQPLTRQRQQAPASHQVLRNAGRRNDPSNLGGPRSQERRDTNSSNVPSSTNPASLSSSLTPCRPSAALRP